MPTVKLAPNIAVNVELGYIDLVPSEKGGPQIRLKGKIDGQEKSYAYLPGKLGEVLAELISNGIITNQAYPDSVEAPHEIKPLKKQFQFMKYQPAGEKYGTFKVVGASAGSPAPANVGTVGATPPHANGNGAPPKNYGEIYKKATQFFLSDILPLYKEAGFVITADAASSMVATMFIPRSKE